MLRNKNAFISEKNWVNIMFGRLISCFNTQHSIALWKKLKRVCWYS